MRPSATTLKRILLILIFSLGLHTALILLLDRRIAFTITASTESVDKIDPRNYDRPDPSQVDAGGRGSIHKTGGTSMDKKRLPTMTNPKSKDAEAKNIREGESTRLNSGVLSCEKYGGPPDAISLEMVCEFLRQHFFPIRLIPLRLPPNNYKLQNFPAPFFLVYSVYFRLVGLQKRRRIR